MPYPAAQVRSVTLGFDAGRLYLDVTAEVPVAVYPAGTGPDRTRVAGWTWASSTPTPPPAPADQRLLVSGRAIRAECRQHLRDRKGRTGPPPAARSGRGSRGRAAGAATGAGRGTPRPGTGGGSGRPSTRPP